MGQDKEYLNLPKLVMSFNENFKLLVSIGMRWAIYVHYKRLQNILHIFNYYSKQKLKIP